MSMTPKYWQYDYTLNNVVELLRYKGEGDESCKGSKNSFKPC